MQNCAYAIGQAVFIRTDTPDYSEEIVPFRTLEELTALCVRPRPELTLDRVLVYSLVDKVPCAVTLNFLAASRGERRPDLAEAETA
jgi:hypothetical protein